MKTEKTESREMTIEGEMVENDSGSGAAMMIWTIPKWWQLAQPLVDAESVMVMMI